MQREGSHASIATTTASRRKSVSESAHAPAPAAMPAFNPGAPDGYLYSFAECRRRPKGPDFIALTLESRAQSLLRSRS